MTCSQARMTTLDILGDSSLIHDRCLEQAHRLWIVKRLRAATGAPGRYRRDAQSDERLAW